MKIDKRYRAALRKLIDMTDFDCIIDREITDDYVAIKVEHGYNIETYTFYNEGAICIAIKKGANNE